MTLLTSDFQERDPYRKLTVGLSHAWVGGFMAALGLPLLVIMVLYIGKEVVFDLSSLKERRWLVWADSAVDAAFVYLGAAMVAYMDARYGFGAIAMGGAYFLTERLANDGSR